MSPGIRPRAFQPSNFNGNENYGAVVVASRDPSFNLNAGNGSLYDICHPEHDADALLRAWNDPPAGHLVHPLLFGLGNRQPAAPLIRGVDLCGRLRHRLASRPDVESLLQRRRRDGLRADHHRCHHRLRPAVTDPANPGAYPDCIRVTASPGRPYDVSGERRLARRLHTRGRVGPQRGEHLDAVQEAERGQLQPAGQRGVVPAGCGAVRQRRRLRDRAVHPPRESDPPAGSRTRQRQWDSFAPQRDRRAASAAAGRK